ncbi:MAG: GTP-binding protein [Promethearchaeota archaeon]
MIVDGLKKLIQIKIAIYGPGMCGKTTFLRSLMKKFGKEIFSNESSVKRTILCDYGNLKIPIDKWKIKVHFFATAGANYYKVTRPIILSGCDGIIFIVDSQKDVLERNFKSWKELLRFFKNSLVVIPKIIAFNKQDLSYKLKQEEFLKKIKAKNFYNLKTVKTMALNGEGTLEAFEYLLELIMKDLNILELVSSIY